MYDDNLFFTSSSREEDLISRFSPDIQFGYQSVPFTFSGRYTFDAEVYAYHPELTTAQALQRASIEARYLPAPPLTLALTAAYLESQTPEEINVVTEPGQGRQRASQIFLLSVDRISVRPISDRDWCLHLYESAVGRCDE